MVNGDRLSGEFLFDSLELKAPFGTVTIKKAMLQTIHVAPAIEEFPQIPKPSNTKTVSLKNGDTITGDVHFHEESDFFTFNTQYSEPINFKESMVRSINLAPQIKGRDKVTDPFGNEHVGQVTATSFKLKSFYSTMKIRTSDVTKMKATHPASSWQYKKMVRGIPSTTIFTENWESGDTARWNITDYNEGSKGVTNKPEVGEPFEGQYVMELRGDYSHINKNLNLKKYPSVTIMIWGQVRSLDNPNEYMDMDFYDGQNWHNGVIRFTQEDNTKGYQFRIFHVPENWKSNKNKIRFYTRAGGSGDYFLIDSIVVAG